ncbi:ABC/ECF transporter, transmembrane component [Syntrophomonas zehnderi OL-4]|uniref:ABC/ECF transporter, transmembrane component n=1 Tax=Syntrophomonas zehnderi OL-4 TaxID=690567 RepID=A0A0E4C848_9FIRM|nr:cobalt ECF transporter T component CbiQ [Syntrophomonas zehnderi]CFX27808.1 ABC/ECF transporter, transmembrane component [Syntrophomonas zehnderi OL-4]
MLLPEWMIDEYDIDPPVTLAKGRSSNYLTKSIRNMRSVICEDLQTERFARQAGLLQRLKPGIKLLAMILLILAASLCRQISFLLLLWLVTLVFMRMSRLPVWVLQKRIWGFIPLITLLFTLPMTLNVFVDGTPLVTLYQSARADNWLGITWPTVLFVSQEGVLAVTFLFLRVGNSLSLGVILVMTTPVADIFNSLRLLRIPPLFIMIIEMTYRYIIVLLSVSMEMFEARRLRTVGDIPAKWQRAQIGSSIASLFARSMTLAEEVYQAMCARGYTGEITANQPCEFPRLDLMAQI